MIKRLSLPFIFAAAFLAFAASPVAAECYDECTYASPCSQYCEICTQEHPEFGCVRWASRTCGDYGWCSGGNLASTSQSASLLGVVVTESQAARCGDQTAVVYEPSAP